LLVLATTSKSCTAALPTSIYYKSQKCFDILTELLLMIPDLLVVKIRRFIYPGVSKTRSAVVRDVLILEYERAAFV
jgi:hypothetical protein